MRFPRGVLGSAATYTPPLLACYGISAVVHVATVSLSTLLPFHMLDLGGSRTQVGLLFSVMTVVSMGLRPAVGGWVERFGARRVTMPGVAVLAITSIVLHFVTTPGALLVSMAGIGVASALISTSASVAAATTSDPSHRGEALGTYYLASAVAIAVSPPLAFALRAAGGMALAFVVVTATAGALAALAVRLPAPSRPALAPGGTGSRWISVRAMPVSVALVLATLGHSSVYAFVPLYALSVGQGPALAVFFTAYPLWMIACRAVFRGVSDRLGHARVALAGMTLSAIGYALLVAPPSVVTLLPVAIVLGTANAVLYPTLVALVVERAEPHDRGVAVGTLSGSWDLGVVVGSALVGVVADRIGYGPGFLVGAVGCALGAMVLLVIERRRIPRPV